jgi:DNA-binding response OmpR family regulator
MTFLHTAGVEARIKPAKIGELGRITYGSVLASIVGTFFRESPMTRSSVLLVAPTPHLAARLYGWLTDEGFQVAVVSSFSAAKARLQDGPSVLISEIRLGEYNGLHLAIRAKDRGIPAIVVGEIDPVLEREANAFGATYLSSKMARSELLAVLERLPEPASHVGAALDASAPGFSFISWVELAASVSNQEESLSDGRRRTVS